VERLGGTRAPAAKPRCEIQWGVAPRAPVQGPTRHRGRADAITKEVQTTEKHEPSLLVGVDWATEKHDVCLVSPDGRILGERAFRNDGSGLAQMTDWIGSHAPGSPEAIHVAIEIPRGPVVETLLERRFRVFTLNPKQLDRFRDRFTVAGAKDDRRDARVLGDSLRTDRHAFREVDLDAPAVLELREWSRMGDDFQQERNRLTNRMREQLRRYYPQALQLGTDHGADWFLSVLEAVPSPEAAAKAAPRRVARLLKEHRIRRHSATEVLEILRQEPVCVAPGTAEAARAHIGQLIARLRLVNSQLREARKKLQQLCQRIQDEPPADRSESGRRDCVTEETPAQLWIRVLTDITPAAPFFLAYEAASGRSWTSGMRLSDGERALAGAGLFLSAFAHAGGISKLSAFKSRSAAMKFVDEIIDFSKLPKSFGRRQMMHELLVRGAARLTKRQAQRIEEAVEVLRKNAGKNQAQRAGAVRKALGKEGVKELGRALHVLTEPAKAHLVVIESIASGALGSPLSRVDSDFVAAFLSLGRVTQDMARSVPKLKNVSRVGFGLLVTPSGLSIPKGHERIARAMAELGGVVVAPGTAAIRKVTRDITRALGLVQLPGPKIFADVLGAARRTVVAVEAYAPTTRKLAELGNKLGRAQGPYIIVDIGNVRSFTVAEARRELRTSWRPTRRRTCYKALAC